MPKKDNKTLFETTVEDLRRKKADPKFVMGAKYYREKVAQWRSTTHPLSLMAVPQGTAAPRLISG